MASIIRGTTPTIKYTFSTINVEDITTAYLSIKGATSSLEKSLTEATVGEDFIAWTLTQAETLALGDCISIMVNWLLENGTRGASNKSVFMIEDNYKDVII